MQASKPVNSSVLWTVILVVALSFCFLMTMFNIQQQSQESCYSAIETTSNQAIHEITTGLERKAEDLQVISDVLAQQLSSFPEDLEDQLNYIRLSHNLDALYLQMADGTVISSGSTSVDFSTLPALEEALSTAPYISDLFPGTPASQENFLYYALPMRQDGEILGIFYGFLSLDKIYSLVDFAITDGIYHIHLLDVTTGDFLMDTSHSKPFNLYDGSLHTREAKSGYSIDTMLEDIRAGRNGYMVFRAPGTAGYLYTRYQSVGINNWCLLLTLHEDTAFAGTARINKTILTLAVIVVMLTAAYILGFVLQQKRVELVSKQQLLRSRYMYDVQQILFDSYKDPSRIVAALKEVCQTLDAGAAVLLTVEGTHIHQAHIWEAIPTTLLDLVQGQDLETAFPLIFQHISQEKSLLLYEEDFADKLSELELQVMEVADVHNIMLVPVIDTEGTLQGTLFAVDMGHRFTDCSILECVAHEFMMALRSVNSYQLIRDMGLIDHLTGLKSRNSYETALSSYSATICQNMYCIFIDANGLHEINNHFGHSAGDIMLRSISEEIIKLFGSDHTYRIGGDEFVVFVTNTEEASLLRRMELLQDNLRLNEYYISVGWACQSGSQLNMERLVSDAEVRMYQDKRNFYEKTGKDMGLSLRLKNSHLEQQLQEQQDSDSLLSLMHNCFQGIYAVNLNTDAARVIGRYDQFSGILEEKNYRFLKACREYLPQILDEVQMEAFFNFCDYSTIAEQLNHGKMPLHRFQKKSGEIQMIRIFPTPSYTPQEPDTYWLFEKISTE